MEMPLHVGQGRHQVTIIFNRKKKKCNHYFLGQLAIELDHVQFERSIEVCLKTACAGLIDFSKTTTRPCRFVFAVQ